jgi:AbrB family looped-hinge helix DNA binding protein
MALVKVRKAAQITLPREIREAARLREGDHLEAVVTEDGILLKRVPTGRRQPTAAEEKEISSVVDQERKAYAAERRR